MTAGQIGRYQISDELGRGAMGVVYRATDPTIGRTVAIKTIRLSSNSPENREQHIARLRREAQSAGRLSHPHIVTVFDFIESGDAACVCLEYVDGPSLESVLNGQEALSQDEILRILRQAAEALDYAHSRGVIHRDVKPANVLLSGGKNVKITDFGIAALVNDDATMTGPLLGTPSYMSPEQVLSQPIGGPSDQFSLAVIAYQMLTGEKPFRGSSMPSIVYKVCNENPVPPSRVNQDLSTGVDEVFTKALAKDPRARYANVAEFVTALQAQLLLLKKVAVPVEVKPPFAVHQQPRAIPPAGHVPAEPVHPANRSRFNRILYALAGFAAVAVLFFLFRPKQETAQEQQQQKAPAPVTTIAPETSGSVVDESKPSPSDAGETDQAPEEEKVEDPPAPVAAAPVETSRPSVEVPRPSSAKTEAAAPEATAHEFRIETTPAGANVLIDNLATFTCKTPCTLTLEAGRHSFKIDRPGFRTAYRTAVVPEDTSVKVPLETRSGTVMVRSNPPGARIYVNGKEWAEITPALMTLPAGKYVIELRKDGYRNDENTVTVRDGAVLNLDVNWPGQ